MKKYVLLLILSFFVFLDAPKAAKTEYGRFVPDVNKVVWYKGNTPTTITGNGVTIGGNAYTRYTFDSVPNAVNTSITINMTSNQIPDNADYFYIQGLAIGVEATSAYVNSVGYCSFLSQPSESETNNQMTSFVLKCPYNHDGYLTTNIFFNSFGTQTGDNNGGSIYLMVWHYYSTDNNASTIEGLIQDQIEEDKKTNQNLEDLNDNLTSSDTSDASSSADSFFNDFDKNDYGLADIVKIPLNFITNISSATCTPLSIPIPFVDTDFTLPCMYSIYQTYFGNILSIYQTITFGMIAYYIVLDIFRMIKNFKDPNNDEIEVLEL